MQRDSSPARGGKDGGAPSAYVVGTEGIGLTSSLYSSIFPPRPLYGSSVSVTPGSGDEDNSNPNPSPLITSQDLDLAYSPQTRLVLEHQDLLDRHHLCLAHLHETAKQAEALRRENTNLRLANRDLNKRLGLLIQASLHKRFAPSDFSSLSLLGDIRRLSVGENVGSSGTTTNRASWPVADANRDRESPKSVIEGDRIERLDVERVTLPKSISVRSSGYLKNTVNVNATPTAGATSAAAAKAASGSNRVSTTQPRTASPVAGTKVYVRGGTQEDDALELEVYNQGMFKTELCNKWQETGACPYGDHCQFAHGIKELRPVIRHPRYKTEVCRMILAGDNCPYGHRCHFRHALSEDEKFMAPHYSMESKANP